MQPSEDEPIDISRRARRSIPSTLHFCRGLANGIFGLGSHDHADYHLHPSPLRSPRIRLDLVEYNGERGRVRAYVVVASAL